MIRPAPTERNWARSPRPAKIARSVPVSHAWAPLSATGRQQLGQTVLTAAPEFIDEWVSSFDTKDDPVGDRVIESGKNQIKRLLPDADDLDRRYLALGMVAHQAWLYTTIMSLANDKYNGRVPPILEAVLVAQEIRLTTVLTLFEQLAGEADMSAFEAAFKEEKG